MMNFKIFIPIVLLVAAYAIYEFKKSPLKEGESQAVLLKHPDINKIIISKENKIELTKEENNWKVKASREYNGDTIAVDKFLEEIKSFTLEKLEGAVDLPKYGLDNPTGFFELHDTNGNIEKLSIGSTPGLNAKVYIAKGSDIYISSVDWNRLLEKTEGEFRDKSVIDLSEGIQKIKVEGKSKFTIEKSEDTWVSSGIELSYSEVDAFMARAAYLQAVEFIGEEDTIKNPTLTVSFVSEKGTDTLKVSDEVSGNYALVYSSQKNILVRVMSEYTTAMMLDRDDFRDKTKPFEFNSENINSIILNEDGKTITISKTDEQWLSQDLDVDSMKVSSLIENISSLQVDEFIDQDIRKRIEGQNSLEFKNNDEMNYKLHWNAYEDKIEAFSSIADINFTIAKDDFFLPIAEEIKSTVTATTQEE